jgi:hypothetical protein
MKIRHAEGGHFWPDGLMFTIRSRTWEENSEMPRADEQKIGFEDRTTAISKVTPRLLKSC